MGYSGARNGKGDRDRSDLKVFKREYEKVDWGHKPNPGKSRYKYPSKKSCCGKGCCYSKGSE